MDNKFDRTINLIGEEKFNILSSKKIAIIGLGGVGGTSYISLLRTGIKNFLLIDKDVVSVTNLNRQILYVESDIGLSKVGVAKTRGLEINKSANIDIKDIAISNDNIEDVLSSYSPDFIIDAVDDVAAKIAIVKFAKKYNIPFVCSMGMAKRIDPSKVCLSNLNKATGDGLAKKFRYELKQNGVATCDIPVVYSSEIPMDGVTLNSIMTVTSTAGLLLSSYVISYYIK